MDYIELDVKLINPDELRDIIVSELSDLGFESFIETADGVQAYIPAEKYTKELIYSSEIIGSFRDQIAVTDKFIEARNWNAEWESSFQPVVVGEQCVIRASFHPSPEHVKYDIVIDPNMSFGTGHHETTWLMVNECLQMDFQGKSVLDMGCGTAVLAILAAKLGAKEVMAIDIEEGAVKNSIENIELNNVNNIAITVKKGDSSLLADSHFHLILANINKNVLLADIPRYSECLEAGGELLLSGFFETDASTITTKAAAAGLTIIRQNLKNQWCLLHFVKEPSFPSLPH
jgi:ribosomal protein L11 methyltransferase